MRALLDTGVYKDKSGNVARFDILLKCRKIGDTAVREAMFIKNAWYVIASTDEIGRTPLSRTVCGDEMVLFRTEDGTPAALLDQCPHRRYPLSRGTVVGDTIECGYHGFCFGADAKCTHVPGSKTISPKLNGRIYPLVERYDWAWVWPGDAALADPDLIPDMHWKSEPGWAAEGGLIELDCHYQLQSDNLLDLTHEAFVHKRTIGNPAVAETPSTVRLDGERVHVDRIMRDITAPPLFQKVSNFDGNIDRYQLVWFEAPANIWIDAFAYPTGTEDASRGMRWVVMNSITPSTADTALYFYSLSRNFNSADTDMTAMIEGQLHMTLLEDKVVLEEQQRVIADDDPTGANLVNSACDAGSVYARRIVQNLIGKEDSGRQIAAE